ncbi:MAG TPA: hypothetical protein PLX70_09640, partial [Solirubrobacterales bacterium]|nr:hypothetical protein [Solirubrobacterales bacterium]
GPRARDRYQQAVSSFFPFLDSARNMVDEPDRIPTQVARVIVGGVSALMFNEASNGRASDLPKLLPEMMYLAVTPYFGHDRGIEAMEETKVAA